MSKQEQNQKCGFHPLQRYVIAIMLSFALLNGYSMRICLSMTITEMIAHGNDTSVATTTSENVCPVEDGKNIHTVQNTEELFEWSEYQQGLILGSFYWGYIFSHLPGGLLAEKYGAKHILGIGMLINSLMTLLTPIALNYTRDISVMILLRVIEGLGQGPLYPAVGVMLNHWAPLKERAFLSCITFSGATLGIISGNLISGYLITTVKSWTTVFYFFGVVGLIWNILWQILCYSTPDTHPFIQNEEKDFINNDLKTQISKTNRVVPWRKILSSSPVWCLVVGQVGHDWEWYTLVTDLPKYFKSALKLNIKENGWASSVPYGILAISIILAGYLADYLVNKKYLSITTQRKIFTVLGTTVPSIFMVIAAYVGCDKVTAVIMFFLSVSTMCFWNSGLKVNIMDIAPNFSGTINAIVNGLGVISGMLVPYIIGLITPDQTISQWKVVFWISFIVPNVAIAIYAIFGTSEIQEWNKSDEGEDVEL